MSGNVGLRNPITGIAGGCARATSGEETEDAAAPPSSVKSSRRFHRWRCIRPLRGSIARRRVSHASVSVSRTYQSAPFFSSIGVLGSRCYPIVVSPRLQDLSRHVRVDKDRTLAAKSTQPREYPACQLIPGKPAFERCPSLCLEGSRNMQSEAPTLPDRKVASVVG